MIQTTCRAVVCGVVGLAMLIVSTARAAEVAPERFRSDVQTLAGFGSRVPGTPGYDQARVWIRQQLSAIPGVEWREQTYHIMAPVTEFAQLQGAEFEENIAPFWPAFIRTSSTPPQGITGRLIYAGTATYGEIPPRDMAGQIAIIEATARDNWTNAAYFGARAILILGSEAMSHVDLREHDLAVPVNIPRFYIPPGRLADQLRRGEISGEVTIRSRVKWQRVEASNFIALLAPPGATGPAMTLSAPFDSTGLVPDAAVGAGQAVQAAAAIELLRGFAARPPARPVMIVLGGADGMQFQGTRQLLLALAESPVKWRDELATHANEEATLNRDIQRLASLNGDPTSLNVSSDRSLIKRIVQVLEVDVSLEQDQLFRLRLKDQGGLSDEERAADAARITELETSQILLNQLKYAFQQEPGQLNRGDFGNLPGEYLRRTQVRLTGGEARGRQVSGLQADYAERRRILQQRLDLYEWLATRLGRRMDLRERDSGDRIIDVLIALDLSDGGVRVGPLFWGQFLRISSLQQIQSFRDWFTRVEPRGRDAAPPPAWWTAIKPRIDFEPLNQSRSAQSYLASPMAIGSELASSWGVPAFTMMTLDDLRLRRDTPLDTLDRLNLDAIVPQLEALGTLLGNAWADPRFRGDPEFKRQRNSFEGQVVGAAAGRPVPDLPRDGFLVTYFHPLPGRIPRPRQLPWTLGVRRIEVIECDSEGKYRVEGLSRLQTEMQSVTLKVYGMDPRSGAITHSSDVGRQAADLRTTVDLRSEINPVRNLIFNAAEFTLTNLYDPRFLQSLGEVLLIDARRNAEPQRFDVILQNRLMAGFVEPGSRLILLFRYGRVGNRLILLNMLTPEQAAEQVTRRGRGGNPGAQGYYVHDLSYLGPLSLRTAMDFITLDKQRLEEYRRNGVFSGMLDDLHARSSAMLDDAKAAFDANDGNALMKHSTGAWALEARVYSAAASMANDVVNAAIFLLLLCVPFAFCMERLVIGAASIYKQIGGMMLIFGIMTAALWAFHPAFKISSSPLIIILAFAIILMSSVVINVVYSRFDTELRKLRSGKGGAATTSFARASVLASAVQLGIANMRRRKFRTALTSITVVLITFAVLCFASTSRYIDTTTLPTGIPTEGRHGLLLRQRGFRPMPPAVINTLQTVYPGQQFVERWWNLNAADPKENFNIVAGGYTVDGQAPRVAAAMAMLGLSPGEAALSAIDEVIGAEKYARMENGETDIIFLPTELAQQLKVKEGDRVRVGGIELEVAGIFNANDFEQRVVMLSGEPIAPLRYQSGMLDASGKRMDTTDADALALDSASAGAEVDMAYEHLPPSQFAIVPAVVSRQLHNGTLRSVAVKLANEKEVESYADELTRRLSLATFAGFDDGVKLVAASDLASVRGFQVAIPLAVGGLIIFNTMMGSIAERRREIHVYTSLGLAPMHVGALFVAEAMTYGLIGAVFGYVIGQGVGTILQTLGWLGGATLNYSGTSAMMTMGLILLVVLLSALVPARLASKIAAPSIDRTWKVPLPKGDQIIAQLPFTINKTAADGALAYLADFFEAHQEGSIGKFSAGKVEPFAVDEKDGTTSRGIKTVIWLTPFDLGVRQHLMLLIHPGEFPDIYEVQVVLERLSGDDGSWYRMNRTFLTELRKQFLQWRSLAPDRMLQYVEESRKLFGTTPARVVTTTPGEQVRLG